MLRYCCLILIMTALPAKADIWTFETPSGNIQCSVGEDFDIETDIFCTIVKRTGPPALPRPPDCQAGWGHEFTMRAHGPASMLCQEPPAPDSGKPGEGQSVAEYGVTGDLGGIVCHSAKNGLKCTNSDGHGFFLSRATQIIF